MPALYFYADNGRPVRSLLYGFLFWLLRGTDEEILDRKRVFTLYRQSFEQILRDNKEDVVTGITRKTGSGPEVTYPTAQYFQGVLELLIRFSGDTNPKQFEDEYAKLTSRLTNSKKPLRLRGGSTSPTFSASQKSELLLDVYFDRSPRCELCGGLLDPDSGRQHDHIQQRERGGLTVTSNQRLLHPFCNLERERIQDEKAGKRHTNLPIFFDADMSLGAQQLPLSLVFFDDKPFLEPYTDEETE